MEASVIDNSTDIEQFLSYQVLHLREVTVDVKVRMSLHEVMHGLVSLAFIRIIVSNELL